MKLIEAIFAFAAFGFATIWADQYIYKGASWGNSYFYIMFALAAFMGYLYFRGKRIMKANENKNEGSKQKKK